MPRKEDEWIEMNIMLAGALKRLPWLLMYAAWSLVLILLSLINLVFARVLLRLVRHVGLDLYLEECSAWGIFVRLIASMKEAHPLDGSRYRFKGQGTVPGLYNPVF
jgi:hypothetical protein